MFFNNGKAHMNERLARIDQHLKKTNGDLKKLERLSAQMDAEEDKLLDFFRLLPVLVCIANDKYFLELNEHWHHILGWTTTELKSQPYVELIHPDDVSKTVKQINEINAGGAARNFVNRYRTKDGEYVSLVWQTTTLSNGNWYCVALPVHDNTARCMLETCKHL